jgi:Flp pilus assembly pilin Flp
LVPVEDSSRVAVSARVGNPLRAIRRATRKLSRSERGASALEFALIAPVLVVLLAGFIEFGFIFQAQLAVTHAAREGARLAAVDDYDPLIVEERAFPLTYADGLTETLTFPDTRSVNVTVGYPYAWRLLPFGDPVDLMGTATMRTEY